MKLGGPMFTRVVAGMGMAALFLVSASLLLCAEDMKPEDVVARHLDSIGTAAARAGVKSRIVQGTSLFKIQVGGGGELQGTSALVSEGRKSVLMVKFNNNDYRGEQFVTDGDKVSVAATTSDHHWSDFGAFVRSQDEIVREGLLGGELTTAWALLNLHENKAKVSFDGEKKADGRPAYQLSYHSKKRDDMTIHLYFDPQTFQHIMTTYAITLASGLGGFSPSLSDQSGLTTSSNPGGADATQSSKQRETRYTIEERFSDFKTSEGLTLPSKYSIHFTEELGDGTTKVYEWDLTTDEISNNRPLDARNFQVK
ncbi:MAG: hypothetical protein ACRD3L_02785 [Terriglobales bacterium]